MPSHDIVCKFHCLSQKKITAWSGVKPGLKFVYDYEFQAVTSGSPENDSFFASTPGGNLTIRSVASDQFEPGKNYYITLTEA